MSKLAPPQELTKQQRAWVEAAVPRIARLARAVGRTTGFAALDELESAGYEGLIQAALRYDPAGGVPFGAFAHYRARGAMLDALRHAAPSLRQRSRALRALEATQALFERAQKLSPARDAPEHRTLKERVEAAAELVAQTTAAVLLSKSTPVDPDELEREGDSAERLLLRREATAALEAAVDGLTDEEKHLIDSLYTRGLTMNEYAAEVGRNKSSVSRAHAKLLSRLSKRLRDLRDRERPH